MLIFGLIMLGLTNILTGITLISYGRRLKGIEARLDINSTAWSAAVTKGIHTPTPTPILQYFAYAHLPAHLHIVSKPISDLAVSMNALLPDGPEKSAGLRKLLEAKDCLVRAGLK